MYRRGSGFCRVQEHGAEGRVVVEVNTPKKRLCSRVAQVAEAGPEGVQEVKPKKSRARATEGPVRSDRAIGSTLTRNLVL